MQMQKHTLNGPDKEVADVIALIEQRNWTSCVDSEDLALWLLARKQNLEDWLQFVNAVTFVMAEDRLASNLESGHEGPDHTVSTAMRVVDLLDKAYNLPANDKKVF